MIEAPEDHARAIGYAKKESSPAAPPKAQTSATWRRQ